MTEDKFAGVHQYRAVQERSGNVEEIWQSVLQVIRERVDATKYSTWFDPLTPLSLRGEMLRIAVPNKFTRAWLMENYQSLLVDNYCSSPGCRIRSPLWCGLPDMPPAQEPPTRQNIFTPVRPPVTNGQAPSIRALRLRRLWWARATNLPMPPVWRWLVIRLGRTIRSLSTGMWAWVKRISCTPWPLHSSTSAPYDGLLRLVGKIPQRPRWGL